MPCVVIHQSRQGPTSPLVANDVEYEITCYTSTVSISYLTYNYVNLGAVVENNHLQRVPKVVLTAQIRVANAAQKTGFRLMPDDEGTWDPENRAVGSSGGPLKVYNSDFFCDPSAGGNQLPKTNSVKFRVEKICLVQTKTRGLY